MESRILRLSEVHSTNSLLRDMALSGAPGGQVVIASRQSSGRGRSGRSFSSPEGGLYLSYLHRPGRENISPGSLTAGAAVAVCRAVSEACGVEPGIKWVNDLLLDGKKICGILAEAVMTAEGLAFIIGVGLNVNSKDSDFPEELRPVAGSILSHTGRHTETDALARAVIAGLDSILSAPPETYLDLYRSRCLSLGRELLVTQGARQFPAFAESISPDFGLIVRLPDGKKETLLFGEVSTRL